MIVLRIFICWLLMLFGAQSRLQAGEQLSPSQCQLAKTQCGLDHLIQDQEKLRELEAAIDILIESFLENTSLAVACSKMENLANKCVVSSWGEWSRPVGFGTQSRERTIVQPGLHCPQALLEVKENRAFAEIKVGVEFENNFIHEHASPRDILFIVDTSGSISFESFMALKKGLKILVDLFCRKFGEAPNDNRFALIVFSSEPEGQWVFRDPQSLSEIRKTIDDIYHMRENTCTSLALIMAKDIFSSKYGSRGGNVQHDTLLITDGYSNCGPDLKNASLELQKVSNVYALTFEPAVDEKQRREIELIVSEGDPHNIFSLAQYRDFETMMNTISKEVDSSPDKCVNMMKTTGK